MTRLRTVEIYRDDNRKVVAIEAIELNQAKFNSGGQVNGSITPLAIIVCSSKGNAVLAVDADDDKLENNKALRAELAELIDNACRDNAHAQIAGD